MEGTEPPRNGACARWVFKEKAATGNLQPRLFINPVPPVGLEPFDSPDSISSACFYMISWMVLSVAFKTALH